MSNVKVLMTVSLFLVLVLMGMRAYGQPVKPYLRIETGSHSGAVRSISVDAAERFLVSASDDKTARIWDLRTGALLKILRPPIGDFDEGKLYAVAISPDGATIALGGLTAGAASYAIYIFDRETAVMSKVVQGFAHTVTHLAYSKDGRYLALALSGNGGIRVLQTSDYSEIARDPGYGDNTHDIEFEESGRLATSSFDGYLRLYSPQFHLIRKQKANSGKKPFRVCFSPDGKFLAISFYDAAAVDILSASDLSFQYTLRPSGSGGYLSSAVWSADGLTVCGAGAYLTGSIRPVVCWAKDGKANPREFPAAGNTIMDLSALSDGALVFAVFDSSVGILNRDGSIRWRKKTGAADFSFRSDVPRVSADGDVVIFTAAYLDGNSWVHRTLQFSVAEQKLEADPNARSSLMQPRTDGLAIKGWQNGDKPTANGHPLALEHYEESRSLAISSRKDSFILGTEWYIRRFDPKGKQIWQTVVQSVAWHVNISVDARYVIAALGDGTVRWYTFERGEEVLALFVDQDLRRWVAWNPDGFFASESGGDGLIGYHINRGPDQAGEFIKVDQLRDAFYRPDLISQILQPAGATAVAAARQRIGDISSILAGGLPPKIELLSREQAEVNGDYLLQFRIKDQGKGHGRVVYRIDGAEIDGRDAVDIKGTGGDTIDRSIPVGSGSHTLTVAVYSANGKVQGEPRSIQIIRRQPAFGPSLYVIAVGVSHYSDHDLWEGVKFASADADILAASFKEQEGLGLYRKVSAVSLPDRQATIKNIKDEVAKAAKTVQPGDTFILYMAGHGVAQDGEYYFIPWEAEYTNREQWLARSLNREAIQALLKQIPTNKSVLILDTCNGGNYLGNEGRGGGNEKAAVEKVALMSGRAVLAASNSDQMAMDGYQNHGVFTYALLQGLQQADTNADGEILISRLAEFVQSRVPALAEEKWHYRQIPVFRMDGEAFPIVHKKAE